MLNILQLIFIQIHTKVQIFKIKEASYVYHLNLILKLLASRSVYDKILSIYKKIGQFTYFDNRNTKRIIIKDGVLKDKRKWVSVTAITLSISISKNKKIKSNLEKNVLL